MADWMSPHTAFIISQSHSVEVCLVPTASGEQSDLVLLSALHPGGEFAKLEIYNFRESESGGWNCRGL